MTQTAVHPFRGPCQGDDGVDAVVSRLHPRKRCGVCGTLQHRWLCSTCRGVHAAPCGGMCSWSPAKAGLDWASLHTKKACPRCSPPPPPPIVGEIRDMGTSVSAAASISYGSQEARELLLQEIEGVLAAELYGVPHAEVAALCAVVVETYDAAVAMRQRVQRLEANLLRAAHRIDMRTPGYAQRRYAALRAVAAGELLAQRGRTIDGRIDVCREFEAEERVLSMEIEPKDQEAARRELANWNGTHAPVGDVVEQPVDELAWRRVSRRRLSR